MKQSYSWPDCLVTLRVNPITRTYTIVNSDGYCSCIDQKDSGRIAEFANKDSDQNSNSDRVIDGRVVNSKTLTVNLSSDEAATESADQLPSSDVELKNTRAIFTIGEETCRSEIANFGLPNQSVDKLTEDVKPVIESSEKEGGDSLLIKEIITHDKLDYQCRSVSSENNPPVITVIDFDGPNTSDQKPWINAQQACSKCKSESYLKQVDPFRASVENAVKRFDREHGRFNYKNNRIVERRFRSRSATYEIPPNIGRIFGRRTKSFADPKSGNKKNDGCLSAEANHKKEVLLRGHYYPEGGWGFIIVTCSALVHLLGVGLQLSVPGTVYISAELKFNHPPVDFSGWLGAMSTGVALLISPVTIGFCRRKSTRVTAVLGGLVTALGCLFTSFATQFHQLFFSYGAVVGVGVGITRDCSTLMVAQYFKRKREFVEIFIVSGSGLGIAIMSAFIKSIIGKIGWRLGLQAVTVTVFSTFFLGTFYRSASLYHPQRRAILHLKNQKRKIKEKNKVDDRPPILDFTTLKSKTVRILLLSTGISAFGINTPIFYLAHQIEEEGLGDTVILLQAYLGLGWTVGCVTFGLLVIRQNVECRIARQYLVQTAVFICGICILALTTVQGNYYGYVMFTWIYGIFCGGYHYSLKMYTYERVRARNFVRTWGFVQCSQAIPIAIGVPISGYINISFGNKAGYYFSSTCVLVGSFTLFFIDLHKRNLSKHRSGKTNGIKHTCNSNCPKKRGLSFNQEPENDNTPGAGAVGFNTSSEHPPALGESINKISVDKPELTCISEEGIADMDLPDNILDDIEYIGDCITSCNKVENYLMLSEFENNLIAEMPIIMDRKGRKWSLARSKSIKANQSTAGPSTSQSILDEDDVKSKWLLMPAPINNRAITVIEEASTSQVES
ncbi:monocarboxylate transporter 10 isoform X2 [Cotesia glomerata]|uniref:monocarboxylate transporter 10 isoform X2 n=1 Tax=Cotesia glomerata TaxID=32391 RepID=UPI001D00B3CD|nr:monocarboxylate transporter 10 isoform X2 [Cotesia glomerata]